MGVLCYVVLLLMPVLAQMSDQEDSVRMMARFAMLVNLMPLEVSASCCEIVTPLVTLTPTHHCTLAGTVYCIVGINFRRLNFRGIACGIKFVGINVCGTCLISEHHEHLHP